MCTSDDLQLLFAAAAISLPRGSCTIQCLLHSHEHGTSVYLLTSQFVLRIHRNEGVNPRNQYVPKNMAKSVRRHA